MTKRHADLYDGKSQRSLERLRSDAPRRQTDSSGNEEPTHYLALGREPSFPTVTSTATVHNQFFGGNLAELNSDGNASFSPSDTQNDIF